MTNQEYFDKTVAHLRSMKRRATMQFDESPDSDSCAYLTTDGRKCAVGCHIPDGHPAQQSGGSVLNLRCQFPDLAGVAWPEGDGGFDLASRLQFSHDKLINWGEGGLSTSGEENLRLIADDYGLVYTAPEEETK